jgi:hypothetical protein
MGLVNNQGVFLIDSERILEGLDCTKPYPEARRYIKEAYPGITYMILPHPKFDDFYLLLLKKLFNDNGEFIGWFSYRVPDERLKNILNEINGPSGDIESYLVNDDLLLLTPSKFLRPSNQGVLIQVVNSSGVNECIKNFITPLKNGEKINISLKEGADYISYSGKNVIGMYSVIEQPKWCLLIEIEESTLTKILLPKLSSKK